MTTKARNLLLTLFIIVFPFALFLGFFLVEVNKTDEPIVPLPNPNGYDDFMKAGKMLSLPENGDYEKLSEEQLRSIVSSNAAALSLVRSGLSNQCRVPVQFTEVYAGDHFEDLATLKRLAQAFVAEGKLAEMENRNNDAAKSYLDAFHFGIESMRGGVLIDGLVGIAIQAIATSHLTNLVEHLDAKSCREIAMALQEFDSTNQTWEETMRLEHDWSIRTFNSLHDKIFRPILMHMTREAYVKSKGKFQKYEVQNAELIVMYAARAYELDKGKPLTNITDLVPDYLKAIPQDPLIGTNIVYSPR